ncbi:MAG TPA: hypothetical protein VGM50_03385 [Gemmatimonadaceae bacterium]
MPDRALTAPAVTIPDSNPTPVSQTVPIVILGSDALLAASPATPVQLAHACLRAGFANVIPASWGDELIAGGVLRRLPEFGNGPVIQCTCPIVAHRLLTVGGDLRPAMLPLVPPPVAVARYVKAVAPPTHTRLTYVGACPGAVDESIDIRMTPEALIAMLAERNIHLDDQPRVFESIIPPDRRRFFSQPGGLPTAETLWNEYGSRSIVELEGEDLASELAQQLLTGKNVLIDVSARLGCMCSGAIAGAQPKEARANVVALEPPRSTTPVIEMESLPLDLPVPAAPRTPVDVVAVPPSTVPPKPIAFPPPNAAMPFGHRASPVRGLTAIADPRPGRVSNPNNPRPVLGNVPVARDAEGKSLPRAYVARRKSSPRSFNALPQSNSALLTPPNGAPIVEPPSSEPTFVAQPIVETAITSSVSINVREAARVVEPPPATEEPSSSESLMADVPLRDLGPLYTTPRASFPTATPLGEPVKKPGPFDFLDEIPGDPIYDAPRPRPRERRPQASNAVPVESQPHMLSNPMASPASKQTLMGLIAVLVVALSIGVAVAAIVARSLH